MSKRTASSKITIVYEPWSEFIGSFTSIHSGYKINDTNQYFNLITKTANEGDHEPKGSHSTIDNILFWNKIIDIDEMFLSLYND